MAENPFSGNLNRWGLFFLLLVITGSWIGGEFTRDPLAVDLSQQLMGPGSHNWFGTDPLGRDVFARLLHATRATLVVTGGATALDIALAVVLALVAAYRGGVADRILAVSIDFFWTVPFVVFVMLAVSIVGVSIASLILTIGAVNWVTAARVLRAETVRLRRLEFVRAAEAFGFPPMRIIIGQILPNLRRILLAVAAYTAVEVLTLETGIAFLGLSLPLPEPTWGGMLADGWTYASNSWWLAAFPAGAITVTLVCLQLVAKRLDVQREWKAI